MAENKHEHENMENEAPPSYNLHAQAPPMPAQGMHGFGYAPGMPEPYPPNQQGAYPPQHNVVVVNTPNPLPQGPTVIVTQQKKGVNHCLHCIISILFFPWIIVWICLCLCN